MEAWQTILLAFFGANAALLAVVGLLLGKSLLEKIIARDTQRYEPEPKVRCGHLASA
jgi:hypothetical protein